MRGRKEKTLARNGQRDGWQHLFYIVGGRSIAYVKKDLTGLIPSLGTRRFPAANPFFFFLPNLELSMSDLDSDLPSFQFEVRESKLAFFMDSSEGTSLFGTFPLVLSQEDHYLSPHSLTLVLGSPSTTSFAYKVILKIKNKGFRCPTTVGSLSFL